MSAPLLLRAPRSDERPALVDLWVGAWRITFPQIDFDARRPWFESHLDALQEKGAAIVAAFDAGAMVGFLTLALENGRGHIDQLCVAPTAFGSGAAQALLAHAIDKAPHGLRLDVNADNLRAVRFYEKSGFVKTGEGRNPMSGLKTVSLARHGAG